MLYFRIQLNDAQSIGCAGTIFIRMLMRVVVIAEAQKGQNLTGHVGNEPFDFSVANWFEHKPT